MTLLERMDRAVFAIGIDRLVFMRMQPRALRWLPLIVLAALPLGYALMVQPLRPPFGRLMAGIGLFYGAYMMAFVLRFFGPRLLPAIDRPLDEREIMVKARANAVSGIILVVLTMAGCFYMALADVVGGWKPSDPSQWVALAFGLQACFMLLPTLIASWMQPRPLPDDEE